MTVYAAVVALGSDLAAADLMSLEATNHLGSARLASSIARFASLLSKGLLDVHQFGDSSPLSD